MSTSTRGGAAPRSHGEVCFDIARAIARSRQEEHRQRGRDHRQHFDAKEKNAGGEIQRQPDGAGSESKVRHSHVSPHQEHGDRR